MFHGKIPPQADVFSDGVFKQSVVLEHHAEFLPQSMEGIAAHIPPVHQNAALIRVIQAKQQGDQSGFARAGGADDAQSLSRAQGKGNVGQVVFLLIIGEGHILKNHPEAAIPCGGLFHLKQIRGSVQHFHDPLSRGAGFGIHGDDPGDGHHGVEDDGEVREKGHNGAHL